MEIRRALLGGKCDRRADMYDDFHAEDVLGLYGGMASRRCLLTKADNSRYSGLSRSSLNQHVFSPSYSSCDRRQYRPLLIPTIS